MKPDNVSDRAWAFACANEPDIGNPMIRIEYQREQLALAFDKATADLREFAKDYSDLDGVPCEIEEIHGGALLRCQVHQTAGAGVTGEGCSHGRDSAMLASYTPTESPDAE